MLPLVFPRLDFVIGQVLRIVSIELAIWHARCFVSVGDAETGMIANTEISTLSCLFKFFVSCSSPFKRES